MVIELNTKSSPITVTVTVSILKVGQTPNKKETKVLKVR